MGSVRSMAQGRMRETTYLSLNVTGVAAGVLTAGAGADSGFTPP